MRLAVLKERRPDETRVSATPETVKKYKALGLDVAVEAGAGLSAGVTDDAFREAGAEIAPDAAAALNGAGIVLKVRAPTAAGEGGPDEMSMLPRGALLLGQLGTEGAGAYAERGVDAGAMELLPRITRAQSMDILSSQANLAGYRAVIEAAATFDRGFPMLMTAAGTVPAANVFVMGAGVAGLQAIATARRLGGRVSATDVRPAAKEEIKSLGAAFIGHEDEESRAAQTAGGYAKPMSAAFLAKQAEVVADAIKKFDIVVCTALVQGRKAPILVSEPMVREHEAGLGHRGPRLRRRRQLRADQAGRGGDDAERGPHPGLLQLARPHPRRVLRALRAQPAHLPDHLLGQGGGRAEAARGRRDRARRDAHPRRAGGAPVAGAAGQGRLRKGDERMNPTDLANQATRAAEHAMILAQQARDLAARGAPAAADHAAPERPTPSCSC